MVCIQKVECEDGLGTEHRCWIPANPQQLPEVFKEFVFGTLAETDRDGVVTRKVDDKQPLGFRGGGTIIPRVAQVNDQAEILKGYALEKSVSPDLGLDLFKAAWTPMTLCRT